jgi:glucose uptake protein GlcU
MKKLFLTLLAVIAVLTMRADGYPYLLFQTTDGTIHAMSVESLTMEISGSQLMVTNSEEAQTFTITDLSRMFFCEDTTGIDEIFSTDSGEVTVYTIMGIYVGKYPDANEALKLLDKGHYILKTKSNKVKIAVQ